MSIIALNFRYEFYCLRSFYFKQCLISCLTITLVITSLKTFVHSLSCFPLFFALDKLIILQEILVIYISYGIPENTTVIYNEWDMNNGTEWDSNTSVTRLLIRNNTNTLVFI